jgi:uncharacterized protein (DUF1919 family)
MLKTLITNNCWGGVIASNHNMRFCSPTVNLQILPEEFPQFCKNLDFYMRMELVEYEHLTEWHHGCMRRMFGDSPPDCPLGLVYDTIVIFQHYDSFEEAKAAWDRRKKRIDKDNIGYMFHIKDVMYQMYAERFISLDLPNSVCITEDFEMDGAYAFHVPEGEDAFGGVTENGQARRIIEENFKINDWLEGRL